MDNGFIGFLTGIVVGFILSIFLLPMIFSQTIAEDGMRIICNQWVGESAVVYQEKCYSKIESGDLILPKESK